jgi:hypothetical protein
VDVQCIVRKMDKEASNDKHRDQAKFPRSNSCSGTAMNFSDKEAPQEVVNAFS